ncbi:nitrilase-related carbon-nitrogen hydrolase [Intestinirhabdus alba]|jgi:hypothetical protein|uniref:Carbon-nitrogen hydrolase family protein n=1 Tax=Intestinirhabdus alba TaxID=2899544 RepID=A0A6L6IQ46_9ENTR|nr:nitrilase-related carbon-nitrogen hydrolase [Intestinirhabdus alba]MTH48355.1 carbon-nitrogen hydrolase family protein [Intestinirhabdus alba]
MSLWKIAAAQYEPLKMPLADQVAQHLHFVEAAADQQCELLVFPALSLMGCSDTDCLQTVLPDDPLLQPLSQAASALRLTIIAGLQVRHEDSLVKSIAVFTPGIASPLTFPQSHGACLAPELKSISMINKQPDGDDLDSAYSLITTSQCIAEYDLRDFSSRLQRFSHRFAIAILMANARGGSTLWDENGQLIVRADSGSLLLTGQQTPQGWQGDVVPLRQAFSNRSLPC